MFILPARLQHAYNRLSHVRMTTKPIRFPSSSIRCPRILPDDRGGGMQRTHLSAHGNILERRLLVHAAAGNPGFLDAHVDWH